MCDNATQICDPSNIVSANAPSNLADFNVDDQTDTPLTINLTASDSSIRAVGSRADLHPPGGGGPLASTEAIILLSSLFCTVGTTGLIGNFLVIVVIVVNKTMRRTVTNLFIMNLAVADFLIMLFGIPEIVQFILNRGWLLGSVLCRVHRSTLVCSLYASIMTLMGVCIERYIAIVHPIQAHIVCSRRRTITAILIIWPVSLTCALPPILFNQIKDGRCMIIFPGNNDLAQTLYKLAEFVFFFFLPVVVQTYLYAVIGKRLFVGTDDLHRKKIVKTTLAVNGVPVEGRGGRLSLPGRGSVPWRGSLAGRGSVPGRGSIAVSSAGESSKESAAIVARRGVVKMLISCVLVYFISYLPHQIPLLYRLFTQSPFPISLSFIVAVTALAYINSAANPVLYAIFSQNFRRQFRRLLCRCLSSSEDSRRGAGGGGGVRTTGGAGALSMETMKTRRGTATTTEYSAVKMLGTAGAEI